jgi:hypothetical protein
MEFWNDALTKASWEKLTELSKEIRFVLIGGWAAYLWTGQHKSKDIDIIIDYETLMELQKRYSVSKNDELKKYEIKLDKFDIDIYLPYYTRLSIPTEDIVKRYTTKVKGITTTIPEILLILKQGAEIERRATIKGKKDAIDILTILIYAPLDLKKYKELLLKYKKEKYIDELISVIANFDERDIQHLNLDFLKFKKWKKEILSKLKRL